MKSVSGCGIGLRKEHFDVILTDAPDVPWFEAVSENYMVAGGRPRFVLEQVKNRYPVALHGVSLSIGSAEPVNREYLRRLVELVKWVEPVIVSDHLCWTALGGQNSHDLLPIPFTEEAVQHIARKVRDVQDALGRRILLENISSYVELKTSTLSEIDFVGAVLEESDCELLLDVNNLYVNSRNHGVDALEYIRNLPRPRVRQIHLAGHEDHGNVVIDTHDHPVSNAVWALYRYAIQRLGPIPTLIEWDARIPDLEVVLGEARRAEAFQIESVAA